MEPDRITEVAAMAGLTTTMVAAAEADSFLVFSWANGWEEIEVMTGVTLDKAVMPVDQDPITVVTVAAKVGEVDLDLENNGLKPIDQIEEQCLKIISHFYPSTNTSRHPLREGETPSCRLFHGRGKCFPDLEHLTIDYFAPYILVVLFKELSPPFCQALIDQLKKLPLPALEGIVLQQRFTKPAIAEVVFGTYQSPSFACEPPCLYTIDLLANQNTGFFLDMRPLRQLLLQKGQPLRVLNLFAYTCSLSVAAMAGGARSVVNVDMKQNPLRIGQKNHSLNRLKSGLVSFLKLDIRKNFNRLQRLGPFDLILIDPPCAQEKSFKIPGDYQRLIKRLSDFLAENGEIFATLNSPHFTTTFLNDLFQGHYPTTLTATVLPQSFDFPESQPELGLKVIQFTPQQFA